MEIVSQSLAILVVFALLATALLIVRKKGWRAKINPRVFEARAKLVLTARHSIHLIRIGDRNLILALHPEGITFLGDMPPSSHCEKHPEAVSREAR